MNNLQLKIRHPAGQFVLDNLHSNSSLYDLKHEISKKINKPISALTLRSGYPPQILNLPDITTLDSLGLESGMAVNVEVNEAAQTQPATTKSQGTDNSNNVKSEESFQQIPNPDGLIMIRRVIPADNSCLFNCIGYCLENKSMDRARELREIACGYIMSEPEKYNEAFLGGKSNSAYCEWLMKDSSWGGAIELDIFSRHYQTEICAIDIQSLVPNIFGQDGNYDTRIYLLYDGIHYDLFARNISEDMDPKTDITVFSPNDKYAFEGAMTLARELNRKRQFTDVNNFTIQCGVCYKKLKGEVEAIEHNKATGHANFQEVQNN